MVRRLGPAPRRRRRLGARGRFVPLVSSSRLRPFLRGRLALFVGSSLALLGVWLLLMAGASAAYAGAWWRMSSRAAPTLLVPGQKATIVVAATNVGDTGVNATATPVTIKDTLPSTLEATAIEGAPAFHKIAAHLMTCSLSELSCTSKAEAFPAFERLEVIITVNVKPGATGGEENKATVQGGEQEGAPGAAMPGALLEEPFAIENEPTAFGVEADGYAITPEQEGGLVDTQAGSHPFQMTTTLNLNQTLELPNEQQSAPALPKELNFNLPPGLIGDPLAVPACPTVDFLAIGETATNACKPESAIGVAVVTLDEPNHFNDITRAVPLWNLEPARGEPARFGFEVLTVPVVLDTSLRSNGDYGVSVSVKNAPEAAQILGSEVTIWGVPGEAVHDQSRGWACLLGGGYVNNELPCEPPGKRSNGAFLTMPTSCTGTLVSTVEGQSWPLQTLASEPGQIFTLKGPSTEDQLAGFEHCERLPFTPTISAEPVEEQAGTTGTTVAAHSASSPAGLDVDVKAPQQSTVEPGALAEADVQSTTVALPEGVQLNPSAADGLQACSEQQIGYQGPASTDAYSPGAAQPLRFSNGPAECPQASKVGLVHIKTPLLEHELTGAVYLASPAPLGEPGQNPFNSLLALYIVAEDPAAGILVKLAGETRLQEQTGQITSTFANTPQVPFEELRLELFAGARASLATPTACGSYSAEAIFTPWSGTAPVAAFSEASAFDIDTGPEGSGCQGSRPFAPTLTAGASNLKAGGYTNFSVQVARPDADQQITGLTVQLPPGNAAILASVTPCGEPQASQGTCGPESQIGEAIATSGVGPDPYIVTGGRVYITGPYQGAPYGLSIVTPAVAGPFNLGDVVVRSKIEVDPHTAQVTISSSLPTIVQGVGRPASGVPLDLRDVYVNVDRPNFEYDPTNCNPASITAQLTGSHGATAQASSHFQVEGCQNLPFNPGVKATTQGKTSKANGASLGLTFKSKTGEDHVAKTILTIPATLPARLTTIQKACLAATFEANPAACPEGSVIGTATVHTPVLKNPLTGPIYLVSHGNAAWPDAELVLQGEGVEVILDGQTAIKKGVTTSSFLSVPDAPFESVEAILPEGPHSALTTNLPAKDHYSLCGQSLAIPTALAGQNGATVNETVKLAVQGCRAVKAGKTRKLTRKQQLARALAACRRQHKRSHARRTSCEAAARRRSAAKRASRGRSGEAHRQAAKSGHNRR